jgi:hypothetical protein
MFLSGSVFCGLVLPGEDPALGDCEGESVLVVRVAERDPPPLEGFTAELFHVADAALDTAASAAGRIVELVAPVQHEEVATTGN